ncbi:MAG: cation:proton antiporter [Planctomycetota bacterium]|jgi:CPA2 family monovalent cation:H+ antiporter-2
MWDALFDLLVLLGAALLLGTVCERLRQNAILGYLLAGMLLGPHTFNVISNDQQVRTLAELGVALLLFTIGLEFSWRRLRRMGPVALGGGALQVIVTATVATGGALLYGLSPRAALATGAIIALSSTACVVRVLVARAELDSIYGRHALGILLVQDLAVIPLVILVTVLGRGETPGEIAWTLLRTIGLALALVAGFFVLFNYVVPQLLGTQSLQQNRELPVLLAIVVGLGSAWAAHRIGSSPAVGAFVAGLLLAETPFAGQIRSDIASLRTLLMTLFFSSIGMLGDPRWVAGNWVAVTVVVAAIVIGKPLVIWGLLRAFGRTHRHALSTGICLGQVGEFSFVLAAVAVASGIMGDEQFNLIVAATITTLFLTPYLVAAAPAVSHWIVSRLERRGLVRVFARPVAAVAPRPEGHLLIIGFGPAGQAVAETLLDRADDVWVVDLNARAVTAARRLGFRGFVGDAAHPQVLDDLDFAAASAVVITIPDPIAARHIIQDVKARNPDACILARARYHVYRWELDFAGASVVVDEEQHVGRRLAVELRKFLRTAEPEKD